MPQRNKRHDKLESRGAPKPFARSRVGERIALNGAADMRRCAFLSTWVLLLVGQTNAAQAEESGLASVYRYAGRTASGERARPTDLAAAHRSLPFGTRVRVTSQRNGRSVVVRINDRGPFRRGRIIDVTPAAARELGFSGVTSVSLGVVE